MLRLHRTKSRLPMVDCCRAMAAVVIAGITACAGTLKYTGVRLAKMAGRTPLNVVSTIPLAREALARSLIQRTVSANAKRLTKTR